MIRFTVLGNLASMKNRRVPTRQPGVTIPNRECRQFERDFMAQVPRSAVRFLGSLKKPLKAQIIVYYPSMRADVDAEYVYDLLQKAGVVQNDRYIREKHVIGRVDKVNPRVDITITEAGEFA